MVPPGGPPGTGAISTRGTWTVPGKRPLTESNACRFTALIWLLVYVELAGSMAAAGIPPLSSSMSEAATFDLLPLFLKGILSCLDSERDIARTAVETHSALLELVDTTGFVSKLSPTVLRDVLGVLRKQMTASTSTAIQDEADRNTMSSILKTACLQWVCMLLSNWPKQILSLLDDLIDPLFQTLLHPDTEVVIAALQVLARVMGEGERGGRIAAGGGPVVYSAGVVVGGTVAGTGTGREGTSSISDHVLGGSGAGVGGGAAPSAGEQQSSSGGGPLFLLVARKLIDLFKRAPAMFDQRGRLVIRQLCDKLDAQVFYLTIADLIGEELLLLEKLGSGASSMEGLEHPPEQFQKHRAFLSQLVEVFNWILLTARETRALRERVLEDPMLFRLLLKPFFICCPVAAMSLSLWVERYTLARQILGRLTKAGGGPGRGGGGGGGTRGTVDQDEGDQSSELGGEDPTRPQLVT